MTFFDIALTSFFGGYPDRVSLRIINDLLLRRDNKEEKLFSNFFSLSPLSRYFPALNVLLSVNPSEFSSFILPSFFVKEI